jgi:hypothetical protein
MKTVRLWLEKDRQIPQFQRLAFKIEEVPLSRVIKEGIHPVGYTKNIYGTECCHMPNRLGKVINDPEFQISEIVEFGFCCEIYTGTWHHRVLDEDLIMEFLTKIRDRVYFVENISFHVILEIARARIRKIWNYDVAKRILIATQRDFNHIRDYLKSKNKAIKLSGYEDLKKYPLQEILSPNDFDEDERIIIAEALPVTNFRKSGFLEKISTPDGYLSFVPEIKDFQLVFLKSEQNSKDNLLYNCRRKSDHISMMPDIRHRDVKRILAKRISSEWGKGSGRYCFHVHLDCVEDMVSSGQFQILFPSLTYENDNTQASNIRLREEEVEKYFIGKYVCSGSTADEIRKVLRTFKIPQNGRKADLLRKLIRHAAEVYNIKKFELDGYFSKNRFIYIPGYWQDEKDNFKVLEGFPLKNLLLSMYAVQHMRGNTILEESHVNDAYNAKDLARAIINGDLILRGTFIRVEKTKEDEGESNS